MAAAGDLLKEKVWNETQGYYTEKAPALNGREFLVISNLWGTPSENMKGETAEVNVGFWIFGKIDSKLRYEPKHTDAIKMGSTYTLVLVPSFMMMYGPDGKTLIEKRPTKCKVWEIQGSLGLEGLPWTTVNMAIRYVLEMREKTADTAIKKNADETLAKLLLLH